MADTYTQPIGSFDTDTADGGLGESVLFDNGTPPAGTYCFGPAYDGTCFIIKDNLLYYCKPKRPEAWPSTYYIEIGPKQYPGKLGLFHNGQPLYFNANEIWYIQGTGSGLFQPIPTAAKTGAQSSKGAVSVAGKGVFHTGPDGIYLYANQQDQKITEDSLEPIFRGEDKEALPGIADITNTWLFRYKNFLYFGYQATGETYPVNIIVLNMLDNRLTHYVYNDGSDLQVSAIAADNTNKRIIIGDYTGFLRTIEDRSNTTDDGSDVAWQIQSKDFTNQLRKHFPRWCKYDVDASDATAVTGALLLDGAIAQSHTITGSRVTKRRLVETGNGDRASLRITGTGPAEFYSAEFE